MDEAGGVIRLRGSEDFHVIPPPQRASEVEDEDDDDGDGDDREMAHSLEHRESIVTWNCPSATLVIVTTPSVLSCPCDILLEEFGPHLNTLWTGFEEEEEEEEVEVGEEHPTREGSALWRLVDECGIYAFRRSPSVSLIVIDNKRN